MVMFFPLFGLIHTLFVLDLRALALLVIDNAGNTAPFLDQRKISLYAPYNSTCPSTPLVREASGISTGELNYMRTRTPIATACPGTWLQQVNPGFSTANLLSV
jgi:lysophospholipase